MRGQQGIFRVMEKFYLDHDADYKTAHICQKSSVSLQMEFFVCKFYLINLNFKIKNEQILLPKLDNGINMLKNSDDNNKLFMCLFRSAEALTYFSGKKLFEKLSHPTSSRTTSLKLHHK